MLTFVFKQEVDKDMETVDLLKIWLLKNKQTTHWKTTKATSAAIYALLAFGKNYIEENKDVYELLDLKFGLCRLMLAVPEAQVRPQLTDYANLRIATKYPQVTQNFFSQQSMQVEIIKLNGSIELAPMVGLADLIVDIVETGTTLKANKLQEIHKLHTCTARLIANRVSFRMKFNRLHKLVCDLQTLI